MSLCQARKLESSKALLSFRVNVVFLALSIYIDSTASSLQLLLLNFKIVLAGWVSCSHHAGLAAAADADLPSSLWLRLAVCRDTDKDWLAKQTTTGSKVWAKSYRSSSLLDSLSGTCHLFCIGLPWFPD